MATRAHKAISRRRFLRTGAVGAVGLAGLAPGIGPRAAAAAEPSPVPATLEYPYVPRPNRSLLALEIASTKLDPDGKKEMPGVTANGTFPGPEIRLRRGEQFRVRVENRLDGEPTAIHWHGLLVPAAMDGVPDISNAPIAPGGIFVYEFPILQSGTYWYHSHVGFQEQLGLAGPLIIEDPDGSRDRDAFILLSDWLHRSPESVFAQLRGEPPDAAAPGKGDKAAKGGGKMSGGMGMGGGSSMGMGAETGSGMGAGMGAGTGSGDGMAGMKMGGPSSTPPASPGGMAGMAMGQADLSDVKYDAFLLNGRSTAAPWSFAAEPGERIRLRIVNAGSSTYFRLRLDGHALQVTHADGIAIEPVEVDHLLMGMAENYDVVVSLAGSGSYTLHAVAQDGSGQAIGVLHTPDAEPKPNTAMPKFDGREIEYGALRSIAPTTLPDGPARPFDLALQGDMARYVWMINGQAYPKADPLPIRRGERVQIAMKNETAMWHPMHLHGHFFRVLQGAGDRCPLKHTVNVAPRATVKIEFTADNPGRWFFHCHNLYHLEAGMARVFEYRA